MASRLSWLQKCTATQLKSIADATGINCSGTKPILTKRLLNELPLSRFSRDVQIKGTSTGSTSSESGSNKTVVHSQLLAKLPKLRRIPKEDLMAGGARELKEGREAEKKGKEGRGGRSQVKEEEDVRHTIISIDMGIRNLAYCCLIIPEPSAPNTQKPTLTHWSRVAISPKPQTPPSTEVSEAFDPETFATYAHDFVTQTLLPLEPSHILIERQRFRSMGGSNVQEWTLRVNMFEAMLYGVLKTFREQGLWAGQVHPVTPSKVAKFWVGHDDQVWFMDADVYANARKESERSQTSKGQAQSRTKSARTKTAKINLLADLLRANKLHLIQPAQATARAYLSKKRSGSNVSMKHTPTLTPVGELKDLKLGTGPQEQLAKLDDLADCLLQGLGWWEWEKNRRRIMEEGKAILE